MEALSDDPDSHVSSLPGSPPQPPACLDDVASEPSPLLSASEDEQQSPHAIQTLPDSPLRATPMQKRKRGLARLEDDGGVFGLTENKRRDYNRNREGVRRVIHHVANSHNAVAEVWNRSNLRVGTRLANQSWPLGECQTEPRPHPNSWTADGTMWQAFVRLGTSENYRTRKHHRPLAAPAAVALTHQTHLRQKCGALQLQMQCGWPTSDGNTHKLQWLWYERRWDETLVNVRYGLLVDIARPLARYWWKDTSSTAASDSWQLLSYEEFQRRNEGNKIASGTLQMFAHSGSITFEAPHTSVDFMVRHRIDMMYPPRFMTTNNGSSIFAALEKANPKLQWKHIQDMAEHASLIVLSFTADLDGANNRAKFKYQELVKEHNEEVRQGTRPGGRIAMLDLDCKAHVLHAGVGHIYRLERLIGKLHSTAFTANQSGFYALLSMATGEIVREDIESNFFPGMLPPQEWRTHNERILKLTLLRHQVTKADSNVVHMGKQDDDALAARMLDTINILWNGEALGHCCFQPGCCAGRKRGVCIRRMESLLMAAIVDRLGKNVPAENRWHTVAPTMETQGLGFMCCRFLCRLVRKVGSRLPLHVVQDIPEWQMSWREYVSKKEKTSIEFCNDQPTNGLLLGTACAVTESVDHLSARLQSCDYTGRSLRETFSVTGPIARCQHFLYGLMHAALDGRPPPPDRATWIVQTLVRQFEGDITKEEIVRKIDGESCEMAAIVWARMEMEYNSLPMKFLDEAYDTHEAYRTPPCCVDEGFTEVLLEAAPTAESFRSNFASLLVTLRSRLLATNMRSENLIAQIKSSRPTAKQKPSIEELAYNGLLTQVYDDFLQCGRASPFGATAFDERHKLRQAGVILSDGGHLRRDYPRLDSKWVLSKAHRLLAADPSSDLKRCCLRGWAEWRGMTYLERQQATAGLEAGEDEDTGDESQILMNGILGVTIQYLET